MSLVVGTNSYITVAEADTYLADHPDAATYWTPLSTAQKGIWLIEACRCLEVLSYMGQKSDYDQILNFPRDFSTKTDYTPENLKIGQAEQSIWLARNWDKIRERQDMDDLNVTDYGVGDVTEKRSRVINPLCKRAYDRVRLYLSHPQHSGYVELDRT